MWLTPKLSRPSFCLVLKLSHALDGMFSVYYLGYMVVNIDVLFAEQNIIERDYFKILLLRIVSTLEPTIHFQISRCYDGHFPDFGKYISPQLQICTTLVLSADCTESSTSYNIVIFNKFLVFYFPFFNSNNNFLFPE